MDSYQNQQISKNWHTTGIFAEPKFCALVNKYLRNGVYKTVLKYVNELIGNIGLLLHSESTAEELLTVQVCTSACTRN